MPTLIYLHGFASGRQSSTAGKLLSVFAEAVIAEYDTLDPLKGEAQLAALIASHLPAGEVILVGTSLGGFWAQYFAAKYQLKALLVNPAVHPSATLQQAIGEVTNFSTGAVGCLTAENVARYRRFEDCFGGLLSVLVYTGDELLPYQATVAYFQAHRVQVIAGGGHRIESIDAVVREVNYLASLPPLGD